jgi:hypothetical protein
MISGKVDRRRRALFWSTIASAAIHVILLTLIFYEVARLIVARGEPEVVSQTRIVTIKQTARPTPAPVHAARHVQQRESAPATIPHHELAKETPVRASPEPRRRSTLPSKIERDENGFAKEVAQLNQQNDPHVIPTIDPSMRESPSKTYTFDIPSSMRGDEHGNGIITPIQSWHESGLDCYYGRYEYWYPDGATESGNIVWPFCFSPGSDPFKLPPHPIPFPLPVIGFKLPPDAQMPPIEKQVYQEWAAAGGAGSSP